MIFQRTWQSVLDGTKTQTRRLVDAGDFNLIERNGCTIVYRNNRIKWQVGRDYSVQPGRGQKAVARFQLLSIRREDVRSVSNDDVRAEGFVTVWEFMRTWTALYDKPAYRVMEDDAWFDNTHYLQGRPDHLYDAWALTFALIKDTTR